MCLNTLRLIIKRLKSGKQIAVFMSADSFLIMIFTDNTRYKVLTILCYKVKP